MSDLSSHDEASVSLNGAISFPDADGKLVQIDMARMIELAAQGVSNDMFTITPGKGVHPRLSAMIRMIIFGAKSVSKPEPEGRQPDIQNKEKLFLSIKESADGELHGDCIAANPGGPLVAQWDFGRDEDLNRSWRLIQARIEGDANPVLAFIVREFPLPSMPCEQEILTVNGTQASVSTIKLLGEFTAQGFMDTVRPRVVVPGDQPFTAREEALTQMGVRMVEIDGPRPHGVYFPPHADRNPAQPS